MGYRATKLLRRRVRSGWVLVALGAVLLVGCQWTLPSYSPDGSRNNTVETTLNAGNVDELGMEWYAPIGSEAHTPLVASGLVVTSGGGRLRVFDVGVRPDCSPLPWQQCAPVWESAAPHNLSQPIIAGDRILVFAGRTELRVYDLDGGEGCSGTPKVCSPLGQATDAASGELNVEPSVTVSGTTAYLAQSDLRAYPVSSLIDCVVTAAPCVPAWRFVPSGNGYRQLLQVAVAGGTVYASVDRSLADTTEIVAIPEGGVGCTGTPVACTPIWSTEALSGPDIGAVHLAATEHRVVVSTGPVFMDPPVNSGGLFAYDVAACASAIDPCAPIWRTAPLHQPERFAIAEGLVFAGEADHGDTNAYDLEGSEGCTGVPIVCAPVRVMWDDDDEDRGPPTVANGVLYVAGDAFDAEGVVNCTGSAPVYCQSIRSSQGQGDATVVVNGRVYWVEHGFNGNPDILHADALIP